MRGGCVTPLSPIHPCPVTLFNPASTENFFFKVLNDFSVCYSLRPVNTISERKFFLLVLEVCFFGATRFVCLVLLGVRVANFVNIGNFRLNFLHSLHIYI